VTRKFATGRVFFFLLRLWLAPIRANLDRVRTGSGHRMMRFCTALGLAILLNSCASTQDLPISTLQITQRGLVNWKYGTSSISADVEFGQDDQGGVILAIEKQQRLLTVTGSGHRWSATGPLAGPGWSGSRESVPLRLAGWITLAETLNYIQKAPPSVDAMASGAVRARWTENDIEIISADTGERFRVVWQ